MRVGQDELKRRELTMRLITRYNSKMAHRGKANRALEAVISRVRFSMGEEWLAANTPRFRPGPKGGSAALLQVQS